MGNEFSPKGEIDSWEIAGFGEHDNWYVTPGEEISGKMDFPIKEFDHETDILSDSFVVHYTSGGHDFYYTIQGPFDSWDDLVEYIQDLWEDYGGEAA